MANTYSHIFNAHPSFIEENYKQYLQDASSVDEGWRLFFQGFDFQEIGDREESGSNNVSLKKITDEFNVQSIIHGFRSRGHLLSTTNPIRSRKDRRPHLNLEDYGLTKDNLKDKFAAGEEIGLKNGTLEQIISKLQSIYTENIGFEYAHIENREKRMWLRDKIENRNLDGSFGHSMKKRKRILDKLNGAVVFEKFLHTKYVGQKRFSLEGGESTIAALDAIINKGAEHNVQEVLIGMAHRGRLNVLANIMGKTYEHIFNEFEGSAVPDMIFGDGDVKYHLGYSSQVNATNGKLVNLKVAPNPSHLESVNPVLEGFARAKADVVYKSDYDAILPILIHGDSAIAGQGVVFETVQMSQLEGYYTGGSIHFVINNQIGFTTSYEDARSSTYCTGAASVVQAPVFHINGDDPDAVIFAVELATEYRQKFNNDVFIDMVCYRKHGHNEGDDPKFTQPKMYELISKHENPREIYIKKLLEQGSIQQDTADKLEKEFWSTLQARLDLVKEKPLPYTYQEPELAWKNLKKTIDPADFEVSPKTGITKKRIVEILDHLEVIPEGFNALRKINRLLKGKKKLRDANNLDWAMAELMAYASLLAEGSNVRMSGQDVKRGTFSHRHAVFVDTKNDNEYNRINGLAKDNAQFRIFNSLLSEFAVLGFEYGYSLATPNDLVIWEAQFGDFYNGAQTIVDQYITAAESKWQRMSGLVMLLPHGYAGQGPEHSSARVERFLQSCAEFNMTVANITSPANFFHAIRRQLNRPFRKPLVVMSPKSLLRHPKCVSDMSEFLSQTSFQEVIDDTTVTKAKKAIFCSGKIYYDLLEKREESGRKDVAIIRIEQLFPYPEKMLTEALKKYDQCEKVWVQEEPENMGAWRYFLKYWRKVNIEVISRKASASPATGHKKQHEKEQAAILEKALS